MKDPIGEKTLEIVSLARSYNSFIFKLILPWIKGRVAEIGSGTGTFTNMMVGRNFDVTAFDIRKHYFKKLDPRAHTALLDIEISVLPKKYTSKFDTVILLNVLEHLPNHQKALANIKSLLRPGGRVVILVPAHPWAFGSLDTALGHCRRYTRETLTSAVSNTGFRIISVRYHNALGILGWWFNSRLLHRQILSPSQIRLFDVLARFIMPIESLFRLPIGLSLVCIAEKPQ